MDAATPFVPQGVPPGPLNLAWALASLGIFFYLVARAARVFVPNGAWLAAGVVVGNSAAVLLVAWLDVADSQDWLFLGAGGLPVAIFGAAVGAFLYRMSDEKELDPGRADQVFSLLGTACFAMLVAIGLLVVRGVEADSLRVTLDRLSAPLALAAIPILAGRRPRPPIDPRRAPQ